VTRRILTRFLDIAASIVLSVLFAPLLLLTAILIKLDSRGPVFFRQLRAGRTGKLFLIWKFRTMVPDAVNRGAGLLVSQNDPRITSVGSWLRKSRIDELPQLFNVFLGEMSIVGPRPLLPDYLHAYSTQERRRMSVKPGMTGWQQVHGGSRNTWDERIALDLWYVDHRSVWVDLKVLFLTLPVVFKFEGVYGKDGWQRSGLPARAQQTIERQLEQ
jgi:lipopolysaccharide/colanic/teichoic acid biosynthesis glycosyltransferase